MAPELTSSPTRFGVMGSNPITGLCYAVYLNSPPFSETDDLMAQGALFERRSIMEIKMAFDVTHPSRRIVGFGKPIGTYLDRPIPDFYQTADGVRHAFVGVCGPRPDLEGLKVGQTVLAPGLLFEQQERDIADLMTTQQIADAKKSA